MNKPEQPKLDLSRIPAPKIMLVGAAGTGKTYCLQTLARMGLEVFLIPTDNTYDSIIQSVEADSPTDRRIHWHYIPAAEPSWNDMIASAKKINQLSFEGLSKLKDIQKSGYRQFLDMLGTLADFKCDRTGKAYGPVDSWGTNRAIVIDGLSGLSTMAMDLVVGAKPVKAIGEWGVAMDNLERLINKLCTSTRCWFVLVAHLEREHDEISGGVQLMASTLGRKLAPRIPRFFHDVIHTQREIADFSWSTATLNVDLKAKNLPIAAGLQPDFAQILKSWQKRGGIIETEHEEPTVTVP